MLKKFLKISGISLLALLLILFIAPFLFKGKIMRLAKEQINKNINAKTDFSDLSVSFFRHFPRVSVALDQLQITGNGEFEKDTLISAREIDVALNLVSVIRGSDMKIYAVNINEPRIHAIVSKEGAANWNITKPDTTNTSSGESKPFRLELNKYSINNAYISYDDRQGNMSAELVNLNHSGSGDFSSDLFTLSTSTQADAVNFSYGGIPYLFNTKTDIDADLQVDSKAKKYNFKTEKIALNDLKIATEGFFQLVNDSNYNMDIKFNTPSNDFKSILSLVPAIYKKDFDKIKTSGKAIFDGFVKGTYGGTQIPAYNLHLDVQDGFFQYPDLPKPVQHINLTVKVDNPDGITDHTTVDIPKGHVEFASDPFDFRLLLKKPLTDQYIDAAAKGRIDLSQLAQFIKLEGGTKLAGLVNADIQAKGNLATVRKQQPGEFSASGFADISKLFYSSKDFPQPIRNTNARINVTNADGVADHTIIQIPAAHVEVGQDAADLTLLLKTPASDPNFDGTLKGGFNLANVGEFYKFEPGASLAGTVKADVSFKGKKSLVDKRQYDAVQTAGTVQANDILYKSKDYPDGVAIKNSLITFTPKNVAVNNLDGSFMNTHFSANGAFDNLIGYAVKDEPLAGTLNLTADKVDLNKLMGTEEHPASKADSPTHPFVVPKNMSLTLNTKVDQVKYDKVDYNHISGALQLKDETVALKNVQMQALDGDITVNGSYSTRLSKKKPDITLAYNVQNLDVQKTFNAFVTVRKLMPVAQFISGRLSSQLSLTGRLEENMMPDLGTLTGEGSVLLLKGILNRFGPLDKLASTLNMPDLGSINLKDLKNYFEFANGKVMVKPFNIKVQDIDMEIGGTHGFDQSIDYVINMKVPRARLGSQANQVVDQLAAQAAAKGLPIKLSDVVNLKVNMTGTITHPALKTDIKGSAGSVADDLKQQAKDIVDAKKAAVDSTLARARQAAKDSLQAVKKQVAKDAADELKKQIFQADTGKAKDSNAQDARKKIEEAGKGLLKNINPFKKKKDSLP